MDNHEQALKALKTIKQLLEVGLYPGGVSGAVSNSKAFIDAMIKEHDKTEGKGEENATAAQ